MFDLELDWTVGAGQNPPSPTLPLSLFLTDNAPLVQISFSLQPSTTIKIKDGSHNYDCSAG